MKLASPASVGEAQRWLPCDGLPPLSSPPRKEGELPVRNFIDVAQNM